MTRVHSRVLLIEGKDETFTLPELLEKAGVDWPAKKEDAPVWIEKYDGIEVLLELGAIDAQLSASGRDVVGIVIDVCLVCSAAVRRGRHLRHDLHPFRTGGDEHSEEAGAFEYEGVRPAASRESLQHEHIVLSVPHHVIHRDIRVVRINPDHDQPKAAPVNAGRLAATTPKLVLTGDHCQTLDLRRTTPLGRGEGRPGDTRPA
jgi:hypothetical protein